MIKKLYGKDKKGGYKVWSIVTSTEGELVISYGKEGGKQTVKKETVAQKNVGKANETSLEEQAINEAQGRIKKQIDKGYREDKADLDELPVLPMLAADYRKQGHRIEYPCYGSVKYDGVRCLAKKKHGVTTLESRTGQPYDIPHIVEALSFHMVDGDIWDGEVYVHGYELQDIVSAVKRTDTQKEVDKAQRKYENAVGDAAIESAYAELKEAELIHQLRPKLEFHIFDIVNDKPFVERVKDLDELTGIPVVTHFIKITQYLWVADEEDMKIQHKLAVEQGYEGLMLRNFIGMYESGKRSADLQKYKEFLDSEFKIVAILADKQGRGIFSVKNDVNDLTFEVVMGNMAFREKLIESPEEFVEKDLTVSYQTRYKGTLLPQFPTGVAVRDYE